MREPGPPARTVLLSLLALSAAAEVPGVPRLARPGVDNAYTIRLGNDTFGIGHDPDDFRTSDAAINLRLFDRFQIGVNHSILTRRDRELFGDPGRIDQLTATLGILPWQHFDPATGDSHMLAFGVGGRYHGDLYGDEIQNNLHRFFGIEEVDLPYENLRRLQGVAYLHGHLVRIRRVDAPAFLDFLGEDIPLGYWAEGNLLGTTDGQVEGSFGLYGGIFDDRAALWSGIRYRVRAGNDYSNATLEQVAESERGFLAVVGGSVDGFYYEGGFDLDSSRGFGSVGIAIPPGPVEGPDPEGDSLLSANAGVLFPHFGVHLDLRWSPTWLGFLDGPAHRTSLIAHYRHGQVANGVFPTHRLNHSQIAGGLDFQFDLPAPFTRFHPFLTPALGWRREVFRRRDDFEILSPPEPRADRFVGVVDAGLRIRLGRPMARVDYLATLGATAWWPIRKSSADLGFSEITYQRPGVNGLATVTLVARF